MSKERKQEEHLHLISELNQKWGYANNTYYYKLFRDRKLVEMMNEITYFLYDETGLLSLNNHYILLSLIRKLSGFMIEKSTDNKKAVERSLKNLEIGIE